MADEASGGSGEGQRWLPPEPAGPRPSTGDRPAEWAPPAPPPERTEGPQSPPPQPPGSPPPQAVPPSPYALQSPPPGSPDEAGNGAAVAALVLGIVSLAMVLLGIFVVPLLIALVCGIVAIVLGRSGKQRVDRGETARHRGLAQAGFVTGIIGTVLAVLGIIGFVLLIVLSEDFSREFEEGFDEGLDQSSLSSLALRAAPAVARLALG